MDVAESRPPYHAASEKVLSLVETRKAHGFISAISCPTVYYLLRKGSSGRVAAEFLQALLKLLAVVEVNAAMLEQALRTSAADYEDAIQMVCAARVGAHFILTRDAAGYKHSSVRPLTPSEYLATFAQ